MKRPLFLLKSYAIIFSCFASLISFGQSQEGAVKISVIPPSPNSAALAKYVDFPVNVYNGIPEISLPLGSIGSKGLVVPISLSYHAGGTKPAELGSWVGLGWTLNAGGVITRTVRGLPDERNDGLFIG
ncbi:hypothetical protein DBR43_14905, partial [Pedobacter sp. KBW06]|uniref:hypothetical protein n=1 Tax=Pedobacter sp. KBW06 TaxID=2153359 RepID=UPI000FAEDE56